MTDYIVYWEAVQPGFFTDRRIKGTLALTAQTMKEAHELAMEEARASSRRNNASYTITDIRPI